MDCIGWLEIIDLRLIGRIRARKCKGVSVSSPSVA